MAPSPLPTSEDALAYFVQSTKGVVEQFATQSGFDKGQIALFESFVRRDSRDSTSALDKVAALEGSEGYILDMLLVRVLQIKLKNVLAEDEIALLDKDVDLTSDTEDVPLYIGVLCKVGVHFSEHFGLTMDAAASEPQELFKKINHICPLSVTVARAWLLANTTIQACDPNCAASRALCEDDYEMHGLHAQNARKV